MNNRLIVALGVIILSIIMLICYTYYAYNGNTNYALGFESTTIGLLLVAFGIFLYDFYGLDTTIAALLGQIQRRAIGN